MSRFETSAGRTSVSDEPSVELPEGVFHLLVAEKDLVWQVVNRACPTLCGADVDPAMLPVTYPDDDSPEEEPYRVQRPRYCPLCVNEAVRSRADNRESSDTVGRS